MTSRGTAWPLEDSTSEGPMCMKYYAGLNKIE
jgi:hypothetical protein